ncbi:MAG: nucleoside deaminase [Desulfococcaceae bacterium]
MVRFAEATLAPPTWMEAVLPAPETEFRSVEERMGAGRPAGPGKRAAGNRRAFGAAVFDLLTFRLIAPGVNRMPALNCSVFHAEMMAIAPARRRIGDFDLGHVGPAGAELVASTEPCAMCFGAVPWSGVRRLICGARDEDARAIGFDEGPKLADWAEALEVRGIPVFRDVLRFEAAAVLRE